MDILIIKPKWVEKIFCNNKIWEIRGSNTKKRGKIGISISGTSCIYGTANIVDSIELTETLWNLNKDKHQVDITWDELLRIYKNPYAWVLSDKNILDSPIHFNYPKGAVIWVKSDIKELC